MGRASTSASIRCPSALASVEFEKGDPAVSLGTYLRVLRILGLDRDLDLLAGEDRLGRKLQDLALDPPGREEA